MRFLRVRLTAQKVVTLMHRRLPRRKLIDENCVDTFHGKAGGAERHRAKEGKKPKIIDSFETYPLWPMQ